MKIRVNAQVRALLVELDQAIEDFSKCTRICADPSSTDPEAVNAGAEREHVRSRIVGIAWRINKASRGEPKAG